MNIRLTYGSRQHFRNHGHDITVRGVVDGFGPPLRRAEFRLNGGGARPFYVEEIPDEGTDWLNGYKATPAELRCRHLGEFVIEISVDDPELRSDRSGLELEVEDHDGRNAAAALSFGWKAEPSSLPLDLRDLTRFGHVQEVGMAVNGAFDLDHDQNVIRSRAPVAPDSLFVIGPPALSQEATYAVRFSELAGAKWLGLSDFFAGMTEGVPPRGLKVGWSSAGMAVVTPAGEARSFIAWGDHSGAPEEWAVASHPPATVSLARGVLYRVRHQRIIADGINRVRFRIWPDCTSEPSTWLCAEQDSAVPRNLPRHGTAAFALFQHMGLPIEWSDIELRTLEPARIEPADPTVGRTAFLRRDRPGAF